jgi:hypothetical protein
VNIITGMHRSGTSFVAQCLDYLGADFGEPDRFFPADKWNQQGYLENIDIVDLNNRAVLGEKAKFDYWMQQPAQRVERIINSISSRKWKYFFFPGLDGIYQRAMKYSDSIERFSEEYEGKFVKDPRFCLTLQAWHELGDIQTIVFCFRNPASVAGSIRRRESLPLAFGYRYWLYHVAGFMAQAPGDIPILLVNFDDFFDSDTQHAAFSRLASVMGNDKFDVQGLIRTLNIKLRTQYSQGKGMPARIERSYEALRELYRESKGPLLLSDFPELRQRILR